MKKLLMFIIIPSITFPIYSVAQFMSDYRPAGSPVISSTVNLVSVIETQIPGAPAGNQAINTIRESPPVATNDVWVTGVNALGNITFSRRYGLAGTDETATALIRCPNGDFIYAATTSTAGIRSAWLFRRGIMNWSFRYFAPNNNVKPYCIKKTNELAENYIVAGTINSDRTLLVFKINAGGNIVWNRKYADVAPPPGLTDIPKSIIINRDTIIIAGNRITFNVTGAPVRDLFVIGINQATGAVNHPYRVIDNANRDERDPFINFGVTNEYILTYQCMAAIAGINTGRIAFTRLNLSLGIAAPTSLVWENNTTNSFGHSIYTGASAAAPTYDIGGGTTTGNLNNPIFVTLNNAGIPVAGTYRRLWTTLNFNSTFMMQSAIAGANRYEHHNFKQVAGQNSMSLLRNNALPAPCNVLQQVNQQYVQAITLQRIYKPDSVINKIIYVIPDVAVNGTIINCNSPAIGAF